jgi:hypothetical protein
MPAMNSSVWFGEFMLVTSTWSVVALGFGTVLRPSSSK